MTRPTAPLALAVLLLAAPLVEAQFPWFGRGKTEPEPTIEWIEDPSEALAMAAKTGKPILAYVTSTHCGYCRKMEKETWSKPAIGRLVGKNFVPLKLLADDHPEAVAALKVRAFPTTVLISAEGKPFAGKPGFMEPLELSQLLRPVLAQRKTAGPQR